MNNDVFPFKIGNFNCFVIPDVADGDQNVLLIKTGQQALVFDTGNGSAVADRPGQLLNRLKEANSSPDNIDAVIISHADFDHIGGVTDERGNPAFPNARYFILREELAFWSSKPERLSPKGDYEEEFRRIVHLIPQTCLSQLGNKLEPIDDGVEVAPGIKIIAAPGHTPGHAIIAVSSGEDQLFYLGDLVHELKEIENPTLCSEYDYDPKVIIGTKQKIFNQAAANHILLLVYHLPFPGLGYVSQSGKGFHWQGYGPI